MEPATPGVLENWQQQDVKYYEGSCLMIYSTSVRRKNVRYIFHRLAQNNHLSKKSTLHQSVRTSMIKI
jgi:hypothetical protein